MDNHQALRRSQQAGDRRSRRLTAELLAAQSDTIAAIATPPGHGGVGIVRVSGELAGVLLRQLTGQCPRPRHAVFTHFRDLNNSVIDSGIALYFRAPHSFTGEDVAEFHAHGNQYVLDHLLMDLIARGARLARAGEFSERAFLNGKMDLVQAEALADLISADSRQAARAAIVSMDGHFTQTLKVLKERLIRLQVSLEVNLDFAEYDAGYRDSADLQLQIRDLVASVQGVIASAEQGRILRDGCRIALVGRPNAGKSSLLNALAQSDCAIVSPHPGTTRDPLHYSAVIGDVTVQLSDTAGLRDPQDSVEAEGIRRTRALIENADMVFWVVDVQTMDTGNDDQELATLPDNAEILKVINKIDLVGLTPYQRDTTRPVEIGVSARTGAGLDLLADYVRSKHIPADGGLGAFSARRRHVAALQQMEVELSLLGSRLAAGALNEELAAEHVRAVLRQLSLISGEFHTEELLGEIFSTFCIGK